MRLASCSPSPFSWSRPTSCSRSCWGSWRRSPGSPWWCSPSPGLSGRYACCSALGGLRRHRLHVRPRDRGDREAEAQLVLDLVPGRLRAAGHRDHRGALHAKGAGRASPALPRVRQARGGERPGLHALRARPRLPGRGNSRTVDWPVSWPSASFATQKGARAVMRAVDAIMECLKAEGVEHVFGIPGGANLPTYDALYDAGIRHVQCRHEQGAGHAAEGYARASGRIGVAIGTSGPGATNLVTAIADAQMDSTPTLFITGQVKTALRGTNAFQEADVIGITQPLVKHSIAIERADDVAQAVVDALRIATSGRPGPVLIDLPVDIASAPARDDTHEPYLPGYRPRERPNGRQIRRAAEALASARRPVLYAGGGVTNADAAEELRELAALCGAPVTTTLMALGAFPASDPQWLGMLGMHGTKVANWAMDEADLIVAIGARFDDRVTGAIDEFARDAKIVHIDVDPSEIGKIVTAHVPVVGDAKLALSALLEAYG